MSLDLQKKFSSDKEEQSSEEEKGHYGLIVPSLDTRQWRFEHTVHSEGRGDMNLGSSRGEKGADACEGEQTDVISD